MTDSAGVLSRWAEAGGDPCASQKAALPRPSVRSRQASAPRGHGSRARPKALTAADRFSGRKPAVPGGGVNEGSLAGSCQSSKQTCFYLR